jgi:peptide deformylase
MSILPLVQLNKNEFGKKDVSLRSPSEEVSDFGQSFQKIVEDLVETFLSHKIAVGLAAPQIGIQLKVAAINVSKDKKGETLVIVNPKILSTSGKKDNKKESCMSLPHYAGDVERRTKISVAYQDRYGEHKTIEAESFLARVFAHEIDHLEGVLYIDRMSSSSKLETTDIFKND